MPDKSYLTAIGRKKPSTPMLFLYSANLLNGRMLDYGCGHGFDAEYYKMDKYDPHYFPRFPKGKYDTVTCHYVLNVVNKETVPQIVSAVLSLLEDNGVAFFTVRRDIKKEGLTSKGTTQFNVVLDFEVIKETHDYCIYRGKNV